jgi:putative zinc finger protein
MGLIHTCKEIHRLVSEGLDRDLSFFERVDLRVHLVYCDACTNFNGQMGLIRKAMRKMDIPDKPVKDTD